MSRKHRNNRSGKRKQLKLLEKLATDKPQYFQYLLNQLTERMNDAKSKEESSNQRREKEDAEKENTKEIKRRKATVKIFAETYKGEEVKEA